MPWVSDRPDENRRRGDGQLVDGATALDDSSTIVLITHVSPLERADMREVGS